MTEEFTLQKGFRERRTVDDHKRFFCPFTVVMNRLGNKGLAGPGLAPQEHGGITFRNPVNHLEDLLHPAAVADDIFNTVVFREFPSELRILCEQLISFLVDRLNADNGLGNQTAYYGQRLEVLVKIHPFPVIAVDTQGADSLIAVLDRDAKKGQHLVFDVTPRAGPVQEKRFFADSGHHDRYAGRDNPAGNSLTDFIFPPLSGLDGKPARNLDFELAGKRINNGNGPIAHAGLFGQDLHGLPQTVPDVHG